VPGCFTHVTISFLHNNPLCKVHGISIICSVMSYKISKGYLISAAVCMMNCTVPVQCSLTLPSFFFFVFLCEAYWVLKDG